MIAYFSVMKYSGNPNPKNSNSLEFDVNGTDYFYTGFKQH